MSIRKICRWSVIFRAQNTIGVECDPCRTIFLLQILILPLLSSFFCRWFAQLALVLMSQSIKSLNRLFGCFPGGKGLLRKMISTRPLSFALVLCFRVKISKLNVKTPRIKFGCLFQGPLFLSWGRFIHINHLALGRFVHWYFTKLRAKKSNLYNVSALPLLY